MAITNPSQQRRLSGRQWKQLLNALNDAFNFNELQRLLKFEMDVDLADIVFPGPMPDVIYAVIEFTEARNRTRELVEAAQRNRPNFPAILDVAQEVGTAPATGNLERILRTENILFDVIAFRRRVATIEEQICRIEIGGKARGTGFLVGPDVLLTNYHVMKQVINGQGAGAHQVHLRFGYKILDDGTTINSGTLYRLKGGGIDEWLIDSSPYSSVDLQPEPKTGIPQPDELDYALLRIDGQPGEDLLGEPSLSQERGYIALPAPDSTHDFAGNRVLFIVQHPQGDPLKITANIYRSLNENGTRVTYFNDTEKGSSGSPCFGANWDLVALHHSGDPDYARRGEYNQGIPITAIVQLLAQRDKLAAIA
jgi:hypothetical protein